MKAWRPVLASIFTSALPATAFAAAFFGAGDAQQDLVIHPNGYSGAGGVLPVTVCVDPAGAFSQEMIAPLRRVIATWNSLTPQNENVNPATTVSPELLDFETVALHEVGHCLGLGHPNKNLFGTLVTNFTNSSDGPNFNPDANAGTDGIPGSADDERGDDVNANWFRKADNHPFLLGDPVDSTTYSRSLADLPSGDLYSANANSRVSSVLFGLSNTEAAMHSGISNGVEKRILALDDVAALRFGMSGQDELAGTADDYTVELGFTGLSDQCQIVVRFVPLGEPDTIGRCQSTAFVIAGVHSQLAPISSIEFNSQNQWFFGSGPDIALSVTDADATASPGGAILYTVSVENIGQEAPTGPSEVVTTVPADTIFNAMSSAPDWSCASVAAGSPCTASIAALPPGSVASRVIAWSDSRFCPLRDSADQGRIPGWLVDGAVRDVDLVGCSAAWTSLSCPGVGEPAS